MSHPFDTLTPDLVLDAVESLGFLSDARVLALNSYENRVYQVGIEDAQPLIAKFYRPGRWSDAAILEEHAFTAELADCEVPVVAPLQHDDRTQGFMTQAVLSLSDAQIYPAPLAFELKDFTQVQASVFQVARAPGKNVVYLGCALLILGVFAMLYVRERRLWVWLAPSAGGAQATMALSTNRKTMDGDQEFVQLAQKLIGASPREGTA